MFINNLKTKFMKGGHSLGKPLYKRIKYTEYHVYKFSDVQFKSLHSGNSFLQKTHFFLLNLGIILCFLTCKNLWFHPYTPIQNPKYVHLIWNMKSKNWSKSSINFLSYLAFKSGPPMHHMAGAILYSFKLWCIFVRI